MSYSETKDQINVLKKNDDKFNGMENRKYFCDKFHPFQVKRKKFRTSLLTILIFLGTNIYYIKVSGIASGKKLIKTIRYPHM